MEIKLYFVMEMQLMVYDEVEFLLEFMLKLTPY